MPNTAADDFENARNHHPDWKSLWARTDPAADEAHLEPELVREAFEDAWNAGYAAGERAGYRQELEGGNYEGRPHV